MVDERAIGERYRLLNAQGVLDERTRRLWAAAEARSAGYGGLAAVVRATGISESTVLRGLADLDSEERPAPGKVRRHPGRTPILEREPGLAEDLERLVDPVTRGDPESPLRWTSKSGAKLAEALREMGHDVVERTVLRLLKAKGYSLQANKKTREGSQHPDRDAQFQHINETVSEALAAGEPVISVDAKKRELVGDFKAVGREFEPTGRPVEVRGHDFKDKQLGHAIPYGVYDLAADEGWVSVGITSDTAQFAANTIISWWEHLGKARYPNAADADDHRRFRRVQQSPHPPVASRAATPRRHHRASDPRLPLPARHLEVEQDRASDVQLREPQLARQAAGEPRDHRQPDRRDDDQHRTEDLRPPRRPNLRTRRRRDRRTTRRRQHHQTRVPRRLELHRHPFTRSVVSP